MLLCSSSISRAISEERDARDEEKSRRKVAETNMKRGKTDQADMTDKARSDCDLDTILEQNETSRSARCTDAAPETAWRGDDSERRPRRAGNAMLYDRGVATLIS